jgi:hypothetical protein
MMVLHGDLGNPYTLWTAAQGVFEDGQGAQGSSAADRRVVLYVSTIPVRYAITTSCTRSRARSFIRILDTCVFAVSGLR